MLTFQPSKKMTGVESSKSMFRHHTHCRACGLGKPQIPTLKVVTGDLLKPKEEKLVEVMDLGIMPLANDFADASEEHAGYAPLKLMWCPRCSLGQLSVVVNPKDLYTTYSYVTSHSATMQEHFSRLTGDLLVHECKPGSVVEIGSNDGSFLEHCLREGFDSVIGVEPAGNLCDLALKKGINTRNEFFNERVARELANDCVVPDLIVARHVFCHIDDWQETIHALGILCAKHTVIAIEVPYFLDTVKKGEWDQIYHEHLSYMTVKAMEYALKDSMLHIHATQHYPIHGGAIVILLRRNDCEIAPTNREPEEITKAQLIGFSDKSESLVLELRDTVIKFVQQGKTVVGYGASAKATQWIQLCGFTRKHISFVCDETIQKQYKLMPGTDIPVVHPSALTRELPDYAVMFCWNFADEVINKEKIFSDKGGKWIIPLPELKVV